ncbi:MAG: hypothetical protein QNK23_08275, partial [Crocinitomicaceae bacterium]|nr:hypothetical protein [Crocinitomicaceae bacterium]
TGVLSNIADGTAGQYLTTNGAGTLSWAPVSADVDNGLYYNAGAGRIRIGGPLVEQTSITHGTFGFYHDLDGTGDFFIRDNGITTFMVGDNGMTYIGDDMYWRDVDVAGTNIASLIDDGNDGRFRIYENGIVSIDLDANTQAVFNQQGLDRNFRIESNNNQNLFVLDAGLDVISISGVTSAPYMLGAGIPVHTMYYPIEIGSDGNAGQQIGIGYYRGSDPEINPEQNGGWGYIGYNVAAAGEYWWRMYSGGYIVASERSIKRDIHTVNEEQATEDYLMDAIMKMKPSVYNYNNEYDEMVPGYENHYRPAFRMGLIVDETPDFLLDEGFSGVDIYGVAALSLAGVQHNMREIEEIKATKTIQDFGSVAFSGTEVWVDFSENFEGQIPVVTITSNNPNVVISVVEKTATKFKVVVSAAAANLQFDWIAMAKKTVTRQVSGVDLAPEMKDKMEVPGPIKEKILDFYEDFNSTIEPTKKLENN